MPVNHVPENNSLTTSEVQEVIGANPLWILRWGNLVLLGVVAVLVVLSGFVAYPDTVSASCTVTPGKAVTILAVKADARFRQLLVNNNDRVPVNRPLFITQRADSPHAQPDTTCAPVAGRLVLTRELRKHAFLESGSRLLVIVPDSQQHRVTLAITHPDLNKIKVGQQVIIDLDNYPSAEYGQLTGQLDEIVLSEKGEVLAVTARLHQGGVSTRQQHLLLLGPQKGTARIITGHKKLLHKLFPLLKQP